MFATLLLCTLATAPLTLDQAIARALATHPDALSAEAEAKSAGLAVEDARSQQLGLTAAVNGLGRRATSGLLDTSGAPTSTVDTGTANGTITATLPLFTGFKLTHGIDAARHREDEAKARKAAARADLAYGVTQAFWNVYRQQALVTAREEVVADAGQVVALTRTSLQVGRATTMDVTRARVAELNARGDMLAAQGQLREAKTTLAKLVGEPAEALAIAPPTPTTTAPDAGAHATTPPKLAAATAHGDAARADVGVAQGDRWPQMALVSSYQYGNNPFDPTRGASSLGGSFSGTWDVRLSLGYNVFDLGKVERAVKRSQMDLDVAQAGLEKSRRDAAADLGLARLHVTNAYERLQMAETSSHMALEALHWSETRYRQGYALQVDVIDARRSYLTAVDQRIGALCDYQVARAELAVALGKEPS